MSIRFHRIYAILLRDLYADQRSVMRLTEIFYYPAIDITLWGLTTQWLNQSNHALIVCLATSLVLWQVVARNIYSIAIGMVEELWQRSLVNLFGSSIEINEWMIAMMLSGSLKSTVVLPYAALLVFIVYGINIFSMGLILIPYLILLILSGWSIGFLGASIILYWGRQAQSTPWMISWLFIPISAVYFPVKTLPHYLQKIALATPLGNIFEALRSHIILNTIEFGFLAKATILCLMYLVLSMVLFKKTFRRALKRGLSTLE